MDQNTLDSLRRLGKASQRITFAQPAVAHDSLDPNVPFVTWSLTLQPKPQIGRVDIVLEQHIAGKLGEKVPLLGIETVGAYVMETLGAGERDSVGTHGIDGHELLALRGDAELQRENPTEPQLATQR